MSIPSKEPFSLTEGQIQFFKVFGYLTLPGLFKEEAKALSDGFNRVMEKQSSTLKEHTHHAHYNNNRSILYQFIEQDAELLELLADKRIQGIAKGLAGDDYNYTAGEANTFTGNTIWHRDSYGVVNKHRYIKIVFYLEEINADSGCLRFMPGSHHSQQELSQSFHALLENPEDNLGLTADQVPGQIIESKPGDVVVFDLAIQHATCNSRFPRRMFNLAITEHFNDNKKEQLIKILTHAVLSNNAPQNTLFGNNLINHPDPEVRRHIAQPLEIEREVRKRTEGLS